MTDALLDKMRARVAGVRSRAVVQRWNYRQRHLAGGVWFRFRRTLADASAAYVVSDEEARQLVAEGYSPEPCGMEVAPEKTILFVDSSRLATLTSRRAIRVGLGLDLLSARALVLLAFDDAQRPAPCITSRLR